MIKKLIKSVVRKSDALVKEMVSPLVRNVVNATDGNITICVGIKNRSRTLFNNLIPSMNAMKKNNYIELSIVDCNSDDVSNLEEEIRQHWKGFLTFSVLDEDFSRTRTLNAAVAQAKTHKIFICDADMTLPVDFYDQFIVNVDNVTVWFPICYSLYQDKPAIISKGNGWWRREGWGMMGINKCNFDFVGGYDSTNITWGGEDNDFYRRIRKVDANIIRSKCYGLYHVWHPYGDFGGNNKKAKGD